MRKRLILLIGLLLAACGTATPEPTELSGVGYDTVEPEAVETAQANDASTTSAALPRSDRATAAGQEVGSGIDFCDAYPDPEPAAYDPVQPLRQIDEAEAPIGEAPVQAIMYGTYDCAACYDLWRDLIDRAEAGEVSAVLRLVPSGQAGRTVAEAALEAQAQGGYTDFITAMIDNTSAWQDRADADRVPLLKGTFRDIGLDGEALETALDEGTHSSAAQALAEQASENGMMEYPVLLINDFGLAAPNFDTNSDQIAPFIDLYTQAAALRLQYPEAPPQVIEEEKDYGAWIVTEEGTITLDLFANLAPITVNNFAYLSCVGFFDDNQFNRVIPRFVAQGGDPTGGGFGGVGYTIPDEFTGSDLDFDKRGWISMAKTNQPDSASSQFFITYGPTTNLGPLGFTIFGEVVDGDPVLDDLAPREQSQAREVLPAGTLIERIVVRELEP